MTTAAQNNRQTATSRIVAAWVVVGIPLAYGLWQAVLSSLKLFN